LVKLLYDPQTAGGLLLAIAGELAENVLAELRRNYPRAEIIGRVSKPGERRILVD
jgi:selenophosphate synthase